MVRGCSSCRESHSHMARYPSVYSSNLCRTLSQRFQRAIVTGSDSGPSCSSKTTICLYNCKSTTPISRSVLKRKTNVTFMAEYLYDILCIILDKFIKKSVMEKVTSIAKLAKVDVIEKENLLHSKKVGIRFAARKLITDLQKKKKVSERQIF